MYHVCYFKRADSSDPYIGCSCPTWFVFATATPARHTSDAGRLRQQGGAGGHRCGFMSVRRNHASAAVQGDNLKVYTPGHPVPANTVSRPLSPPARPPHHSAPSPGAARRLPTLCALRWRSWPRLCRCGLLYLYLGLSPVSTLVSQRSTVSRWLGLRALRPRGGAVPPGPRRRSRPRMPK